MGPYPTNLKAVMQGIRTSLSAVFTFILLRVMNSQTAFSPSNVPSVFEVRRVMVPSGDPVARMTSLEYSRSWKASEVIGG